PPTLFTLSSHSPRPPRLLHSFPTRRSSDLSIEMPCSAMSAEQISALAKIPMLVMFGDHLGDVQAAGPANWNASFEGCQKFVRQVDRKSTRLNSSHGSISYAVFCLKKKTKYN